MILSKSKNANVNYLAKIVNLTEFTPHPNPTVERLKCATVDGFTILVGIDSQPGLYVYFPAGCEINSHFLRYNNLYRKGELNENPNKTGMFEDNGRVKAIRLKNVVSEGFILPVEALTNFVVSVTNKDLEVKAGTEFDCVSDGNKEFWINKKYVIKVPERTFNTCKNSNPKKKEKKINIVLEDQFRFHYDTVLLRKCPYVITPDSWIHISTKFHGTSGISAYVQCLKVNPIRAKIVDWVINNLWNKPLNLFMKTKYESNLVTREYNHLCASRTTIKNGEYNPNANKGYYSFNIWTEADKIVAPHLDKGMTAYYEIIGYLPGNRYIQKEYDYKYTPGGEQCVYNVNFGIRIYRVTYTNVDGKVHEFSPREVQIWAKEHELIPVTELYYGKARDLYPDLVIDEKFGDNFMNRLANDENFYMECKSPDCNNDVPHEGVVIKIDNGRSAAFKLKCFKFLNKEQKSQDAGEVNIEDNA